MIVKINANLFGFSVGGWHYTEDIEIKDSELEGLDEDSKMNYIDDYVNDYVRESLEFSWEIEEEY